MMWFAALRMLGNADGNQLIDNLVLHMYNPATWNGRSETSVAWSALVSLQS